MNYQQQRVLIVYPTVRALTIAVNLLQSTLAPAEANPFVNSQNNPLIKVEQNKGFTSNRQIQLEGVPFINNELGNPSSLIKLNVGFTFSKKIDEAAADPFIPVIFSNPDLDKLQNRGFEVSRPQFYVDNQPNNQFNWPNPLIKQKLNPSWTVSRNLETIELQPNFLPISYPNPLIGIKRNQDWIDRAPFHQLYNVFPDGSSSLALPVLKLKNKPQDITQARPQYYVEPTLVPLSLESWPNPLYKKVSAITFIKTRNPDPIIPGPPFRQNDWPLVKGKEPLHQDHEFNYIVDNNPPGQSLTTTVQIYQLPLPRKRSLLHTYIDTPRVFVISSAKPFVPYDLSLPVRLKRQTESWIQTFTALTTPAPGDKPFFETNYPNPLIGAKNFHSGWIDRRRFYFEEPPIQIGQHTWPVFRAVKRSHVGFIDYRIQESDPRFVTVDSVPLRKKVLALTFIDNPVRTIIAPVGLKPFSQTDWPLFLKVRSFKDLITLIGQNPQNLPLFAGRIICLQMGETEYFLEIQEAEYDLEMLDTEYDLDMGGEECE